MKKLKIKKCMTSFLMLAVMVISFIGIIPTAKVYAGTFLSLETTELNDEGKPIVYRGSTEHDVYQFQAPGHSDVSMICVYSPYEHGSRLIYIFLSEDNDFTSVKVNRASDNGDIANYTLTEHGTVSNNIKSYNYVYSEFIGGHYDFKFNAITKVTTAEEIDSHGPEQAKYVKYYVDNFVNYGDEWATIDGNTEQIPNGSKDKPFEDKKIGRLVIKKGKAYWFKTGEYRQHVETIRWAKKSDSGFSLLNNDYALTRIEVKIGNRNKVYGDIELHGEPKKVDNFDEVYPFKYVSPKDNPYDFSFADMLSASKTDLTKYNPSMLAHEYDLYFRIVCSDAIGTSAKFYCGEWTRYRVTDDINQDGNNESDNGHFDNDGKWVKEEDTKVDSGGISTVTDDDEKDEDFDSFDDPENLTPNIDNIKSFFKQLGNVPKAIRKLFSFLPGWVTDYIAFGFVVLVALMIIKAIRG